MYAWPSALHPFTAMKSAPGQALRESLVMELISVPALP
jgi:hypothetical protein